VPRSVLERRVGLPLLLAYVGLLVLASWRHEIRPAFLDWPSESARLLLTSLGVTPAVAVFTSDVARGSHEKRTSSCVEVRVVERDGSVRRLYPDDEEPCPGLPPRLGATGDSIALYRSLVVLRAVVAAGRTGPPGAARQRRPELLAAWLTEHFRIRAAARGLDADRFVMNWRESRQNHATGERAERVVALLRWKSGSEESLALSWRPDAEKLRAWWPALEAP